MRKVILHYHFFKNAGTSVDELLKRNFHEAWVTREFNAGQRDPNRAQVARWVQQQREAIAFSSHTSMLPPPELPGVEVFPILFLRHPIDRIASAYAFERKQGGDSFGAVLARHTSLAGYIEVRLSLPHDRQCRNFHAARLGHWFDPDQGTEVDRARRALDTLKFVGLVEQFDQSVERMAEWLTPHFPDFRTFRVQRNVSRDPRLALAERLDAVRRELGNEGYERLLKANESDLVLHEYVTERYAASPVAVAS